MLRGIHRLLAICLILVFIPLPGGNLALAMSQKSGCGEWKIAGTTQETDKRIKATLVNSGSGDNCLGVVKISNEAGVKGRGGYSFELTENPNNATTNWTSTFGHYIIPSVSQEVEVQVVPTSQTSSASITFQGNITLKSYTSDVAIFLLKTALELGGLSQDIPYDTVVFTAMQESDLVSQAVAMAADQDYLGAKKELERVLPVFLEQAKGTILDKVGEKIGVTVIESAFKKIVNIKVQAKIVYEFLTWLPKFFFDYFKYSYPPLIQLSYTPPLPTPTPTPTLALPPSKPWIAYSDLKNIWLIHPDGSGQQQLTKNTDPEIRYGSVAWSPTGNMLGFVEYNNNYRVLPKMWLFHLDSKQLESIRLNNWGGGFDWMPDGSRIIFDTQTKGDLMDMRNEGFRFYNLINRKERLAIPSPRDPGYLSSPQVSPDGKYVLSQVGCFEPQCVSFIILDIDKKSVVGTASAGMLCAWAPDGKHIVCQVYGEQEVISFFKPNGEFVYQIPPAADKSWIDYSPVWSPDSIQIAFTRKDEIVLAGVDGSALFFTGVKGDPITWSPDGKWLIFATTEVKSDGQVTNFVSTLNLLDMDTYTSYELVKGAAAVWQP